MKRSELKEIIKQEIKNILTEISTVNSGLSSQRLGSSADVNFNPESASENIMDNSVSSVLDDALTLDDNSSLFDDDTVKVTDGHPKASLSFLHKNSKSYRSEKNSNNQAIKRQGMTILNFLDNNK